MIFLRWLEVINSFFGKLVGLMLAAMTISVTIQVLSRMVISKIAFLNLNVAWTEEVARYLMIWMVFVGGALAVRKGKMIAIETLAQSIPEKLGKGLKYVAHLISMVFYLFIFFIGMEWVRFGGSETAPVIQLPMSYIYLAMVVGAALMTINTIGFLVETIVMKKDIRFSDLEEEIPK